jgi:hypothetical protein
VNNLIQEMIIEKTGVESKKAEALINYMELCDNKEDIEDIISDFLYNPSNKHSHSEINKYYLDRFKYCNLTDDSLEIIGSTINKLIRYRAKLRLIGKSFTIDTTIIMEEVCFIVKVTTEEDSEEDDIVDETERFIYNIDNLNMTDEEKRRVIDKACDISYGDSWGTVYADIGNTSIMSPKLSLSYMMKCGLHENMFRDNKLLYVSPLEFEYIDTNFVDIGAKNTIDNIYRYLYIAKELMCILLIKRDFDSKGFESLRRSVKVNLYNVVDRLKHKVRKLEDFGFGGSDCIGMYSTSLGIEISNLLKIKAIYDILGNEQVLKTIHTWYLDNDVRLRKESIVDNTGDTAIYQLEEFLSVKIDSNAKENVYGVITMDTIEKYSGKSIDIEPSMISKLCSLILKEVPLVDYRACSGYGVNYSPIIQMDSNIKYEKIFN